MQLAKEIGITQKSAWFVLQRLREACGKNVRMLQGTVEVDETFIGGLERNKQTHKKLNEGRGAVGKVAVIGMRERGGRTTAIPIARNDMDTIQRAITERVANGSHLMTDDHRSYIGLSGKSFKHDIVKHSAGEYARRDANTNSIESVWAVMKRDLHGVYHKASKKHLNRYVNEFTFRLNEGNVERHTLNRLASFIDLVAGTRITYEENSPMLTRRGLGVVLGDLAEMGYDAEWCVLGGSDLGAWHQRKRIWILGADHRQERVQRVLSEKVSWQPRVPWCQNVRGIENFRNRPDVYAPQHSEENQTKMNFAQRECWEKRRVR